MAANWSLSWRSGLLARSWIVPQSRGNLGVRSCTSVSGIFSSKSFSSTTRTVISKYDAPRKRHPVSFRTTLTPVRSENVVIRNLLNHASKPTSKWFRMGWSAGKWTVSSGSVPYPPQKGQCSTWKTYRSRPVTGSKSCIFSNGPNSTPRKICHKTPK